MMKRYLKALVVEGHKYLPEGQLVILDRDSITPHAILGPLVEGKMAAGNPLFGMWCLDRFAIDPFFKTKEN